jgi:octaprenyl-diphosphate synthase
MYLYKDLEGEDKQRLKAAHLQTLDTSEAAWIKAKMKEFKSVEKSYVLARKLSDDAISVMKKYDEKILMAILEEMMEREF